MTYLEELKHGLFKPWGTSFFWPFVLPDGVPITAYLHRFFHVWSLGSQGCYFGCIGRLCNAFPAYFDITSVGTRVVPGDLVLHPPLSGDHSDIKLGVFTLISGDKLKNAALYRMYVDRTLADKLTRQGLTFLYTSSITSPGIP